MSDFPPQYFGFEVGVIDLPDFKSANFRKVLTIQMNVTNVHGLSLKREGYQTRNQFQSPCQNLLSMQSVTPVSGLSSRFTNLGLRNVKPGYGSTTISDLFLHLKGQIPRRRI
jgi:hypothetical protein